VAIPFDQHNGRLERVFAQLNLTKDSSICRLTQNRVQSPFLRAF